MYRILIKGLIGLLILVVFFFSYLVYNYTPYNNGSRLLPITSENIPLEFDSFNDYLTFTKNHIRNTRVDLATPSSEHIIEVNKRSITFI